MDNVLRILSCGGDLRVIGSAAKTRLFPSDVDCNVTLPLDGFRARLVAAIEKLKHAPLCRILDLKAGEHNGQPVHWNIASALNPAHAALLDAALAQPSRVKVDVALYSDVRCAYVEISCIYVLTRDGTPVEPQHDAAASLRAEYAEALRTGEAYKALKRLASLWALRGRDTAPIDAILDGPVGALAQLVADLRVVALLADKDPPRAHLAIELSGIQERLARINLQMRGTTPRLAALTAAIPRLRTASSRALTRLGSTAAMLAESLVGTLDREAAAALSSLKRA